MLNSIPHTTATLITNPPPGLTNYFSVEATRITEDELGRVLFANIVMLGVLVAVIRFVSFEALENSLEGNVPPKTIKMLIFLTKGSIR